MENLEIKRALARLGVAFVQTEAHQDGLVALVREAHRVLEGGIVGGPLRLLHPVEDVRTRVVGWVVGEDSDARRLMDLTWTLDEGSRHRLLHRFDRLAVRYSHSRWSITAGREAVSWGSGLVFQPLDLFNPFAPTTVDTDYKAGDDLLLLERLADDGSDLQLLAVARRNQDGDFSGTVSSVAAKWHGFVRAGELELLVAKHYRDQVYGLTVRWPVGGAMLRSDLAATRLDGGSWKVSGVLNVDYSLVLGGRNLYLFGEYFHNAFGVSELPESPLAYPEPLVARLARGELFNLMRDYLAAGVTIEWHPLWNHVTTVIANQNDGSVLLQSQISYQPGDNQQVDVGVVHPFGGRGDEYGGVPLVRDPTGELLTTGGGTRGYLRWAYYF